MLVNKRQRHWRRGRAVEHSIPDLLIVLEVKEEDGGRKGVV